MLRFLMVVLILGTAVMTDPSAAAQNGYKEANARVTALIQARLRSQEPARLSADTITLTGDTLRLSGHVWIRFDDISIRAEEAVFDQVNKRIDLIGNVHAFL